MSRIARVRLRTLPFIVGSVTADNPSSLGAAYNATNTGDSFRAQCSDYAGRPVSDSPLTITLRNRSHVEPINGHYDGGPEYSATAKNYIPSLLRLGSDNHLTLSGMPSASSSMTTLLARTNPSRPDYVPLSLLQDLHDIPRMLKDVGRLITTKKSKLFNVREVANQNLGFQFGWKPLFQDVKDLLDLQGHIHRRVGELHRLYEAHGLKRRIHLGRWTESTQGNLSLDSVPIMSVDSTYSWSTKAERWGTVRWLPSVTLPVHRPSDADIIRQAKQVVLGLTLESTLKGAWDLVPWSFIVDWFTNISDFALQYSNTVPARPSGANIMTLTETTFHNRITRINLGYTGGDGSTYYTTKERYVGAGSLDVHLPFIGVNRLSILGSLFVQRFKH